MNGKWFLFSYWDKTMDKKHRKLIKHMKNNSFHLYSQKNHLVFKSAINGSKLTFPSSGMHEYYANTVNRQIKHYHGDVDLTYAQGRII